MDLTKKTTILLSPRLHSMLKAVSQATNKSIGELIRHACERQYGLYPESTAIEAADRLSAMSLPVGSPGDMKRESVPAHEELMG